MLTERAPDFYTNGGWGDPLEYVREVVEQTIRDHHLEPCMLLDAGCGDGRFAFVFNELGYDVTGFDLSRDAIVTAASLFPGPSYFVGDAEEPLPVGDFDVVYCRGITHTGNPRCEGSDRVFDNLRAALKPGGLLVLERVTDGSGVDGPSRYFQGMTRGNPTAADLQALIEPFFTIQTALHLDDRIQVSARPR